MWFCLLLFFFCLAVSYSIWISVELKAFRKKKEKRRSNLGFSPWFTFNSIERFETRFEWAMQECMLPIHTRFQCPYGVIHKYIGEMAAKVFELKSPNIITTLLMEMMKASKAATIFDIIRFDRYSMTHSTKCHRYPCKGIMMNYIGSILCARLNCEKNYPSIKEG